MCHKTQYFLKVFSHVILTDETDKIFPPGHHLIEIFNVLYMLQENIENGTYYFRY